MSLVEFDIQTFRHGIARRLRISRLALSHALFGGIVGATLVGGLCNFRAASCCTALEALEVRHARLEIEHRMTIARMQALALNHTDGAMDGDNNVSTFGMAIAPTFPTLPITLEPGVQGQTAYLWPAPLQLIPLATDPGAVAPGLAPPELCRSLETAAHEALAHFETKVWPRLRKMHQDEGPRQAFAHWQREAANKDPLGTPNSETEDGIANQNIFIDVHQRAVHSLRHWALALSTRYLAEVAGLQLEGDPADSVRIVAWGEVLGNTDMILPSADTGALVAGLLWARKGQPVRRWVFEDPRGINAPFGRRYEVNAADGLVILFPPWISYYVEPGGGMETTASLDPDSVLWHFLAWPRGPKKEWSWVNDPTGPIIRREPLVFRLDEQLWSLAADIPNGLGVVT